MPTRRCRRRRRITASWCRRWCRPRTCLPRCIPTRRSPPSRSASDEGWVFLLRNGTIAVSKIDGGVKEIAELVRRDPRRHRADHRPVADVRYRGRPEAVPDDAGRCGRARWTGVKALVVAPAGPLLSLPFEVLLTGPADAARAGRCARGWCASSPSRMCRRRPTSSRCARSPPARAPRSRGSASATSVR